MLSLRNPQENIKGRFSTSVLILNMVSLESSGQMVTCTKVKMSMAKKKDSEDTFGTMATAISVSGKGVK